MAGSGPDLQVRKGLPGHCPRGGDVEGSDGGFKFPDHRLHQPPRLPQWVLGGSRHRYLHTRGKPTSAVSSLEGVGHVRDLSGPAQGV